MNSNRLVFVKLGGAAITDKSRPRTPDLENMQSLCHQISQARNKVSDMRLIIGHGSGSFGHFSGQKYKTRDGVRSDQDWLGFAEVWKDARQLNELVIHACLETGLPVIAFPPSAWLISNDRIPAINFIEPIRNALKKNLIPVVNGDVIFDRTIGGTIFSTEDVFSILADEFIPDHIVLSSREPGIWQDYPMCTKLSSTLSHGEFKASTTSVIGAAGMDVTGGMAKKVAIMMDILDRHSGMKITVTSGVDGHSVYDALIDKPSGTLLHF